MSGPNSTLSPRLSSGNLILHIWPPHGELLSLDVSSVAALLYLELTIPGQFSVAHCANPDVAPSGQLPFLTHGLHHASGLANIIAYVRRQPAAHQLDAHLNLVEHAQLTARLAHVEANYGDLVNHMLFSLQENWSGVTAPALVSMLPIPQRYYVPSRIRTSHKARLEAVELWHVPEVEEEDEEPRKVFGKRKKTRPVNEPHKFKTFLEREKVAEKARAIFDVYGRLLGDDEFFVGNSAPTTLDVVFAAHTHILLNAKYPDPLVTSVLTDAYPQFVSHCERVVDAARSSFVPPVAMTGWASSIRYLIPWPRAPARAAPSNVLGGSPAKAEEWRYRLWRWGFIGTSLLATVAYLHWGPIKIVLLRGDDTAEEDEDMVDADEDEEEVAPEDVEEA